MQGKRHKPTALSRARVRDQSLAGHTHQAIARCMRLAQNTLLKYYADELEEGDGFTEQRLTNKLIAEAESGNTTALLFALKCRFRWREIQHIETVQLPGAPMKVQAEITGDKAMQTYLAMLSKK